ncbi:MAG: hypothetical protein V3T05_08515 [Myxococcota bacterium]
MHSRSAKRRAGSQELLEHVVPPDLRETVLALVGDAPDEERIDIARVILDERASPITTAVQSAAPRDKAFIALLSSLLRDPSQSIRSITAFMIAELGLCELRNEVDSARPRDTGLFGDVFERAAAALGGRLADRKAT